MTKIKSITGILNSMTESIKNVLPFEVSIEKPSIIAEPFDQNGIGVLIGLTGDISGRILIDSDEATIGNIGEKMFGMALEGEMLQSFSGELGNMLAGNLATILTKHKIEMDITPPTIMSGNSKIYGFDKAFRLPVLIEDAGQLTVVFIYE